MRFLQPTLFSFRAGKLPLRVRLGVYFLSFVLLSLIILLTLLFIFDFLPASQKKIGEDMDDYLRECPAYTLLYQFFPKDTGKSKVK